MVIIPYKEKIRSGSGFFLYVQLYLKADYYDLLLSNTPAPDMTVKQILNAICTG